MTPETSPILDRASVPGTAAGTDEAACPAHPDGTRRRAVLGLAAAAGALCAGCSTYGKSTAAPPANTTSAAAAPGSSDSASASGSATGGGQGATVLAQTSQVPVGSGTILADRQIVLTQPTSGDFKAFTAVCTHQGCTVSTIDSGLIQCPCHGSQYHIADGSVANGPAPKPLAPIPIKVADGQITQA